MPIPIAIKTIKIEIIKIITAGLIFKEYIYFSNTFNLNGEGGIGLTFSVKE